MNEALPPLRPGTLYLVATPIGNLEDVTLRAVRTLRECPILSDPDAAVIRHYYILHPGAGPDGHDIARPAEFLVDSSKIVRWTNFTEDIRVRARANNMLAAAKLLK